MLAQNQVIADQLLAWWMEELDLLDWQVGVKLKKRSELPLRDGCVTMRETRKMAAVLLVDPDEILPCELRVRPYDLEETLVHELLHVKFPAFLGEDGDHCDITSEQAIDSLSRVLVRMSRRRRRKPQCYSPTVRSSRRQTSPELKAKSPTSPRRKKST